MVKINNPIGRPGSVSGPQDVTTGKPVAQGAAPSRPAGDRVDITSLSNQLQALESRLADVSVVDSARVDAIKQAIAEGRFNVDAEVVADRLIATVREYLLNQRP
jgi:negative regulator of flagellin synthesis FlgM